MVDSTPPHARRLRIALAHDWLCGVRGGEHVLERIASLVLREHDGAGLFTMFNDGRAIGPSVSRLPTHVAPLGRRPWSNRLRRWLLPLYPGAVRDLSWMLAQEHARKPIDLVISTSSAAIKGLRPPPGVPHLCYCHSPARYVWTQAERYRSGLRGLGLRLMGDSFREWDRATAANVTRFIANSTHTASEIHRCYGRDAAVVHPPVREMFFEGPLEARDPNAPWLVVSALEPYKCVELAIKAANKAGHALTVVGDGSQRAALEALAGPTVTFTGRVPDEELRAHYRRASLLLFPQVEDFGIVAVEAQACGLPVVARRAGGALDSVLDASAVGEGRATGAFFEEDSVESLLDAVARCPRNAEACRDNAARFSEERFDEAMREQIRLAAAAKRAQSRACPGA
jgi:glycosyltransferase involved in cell wall biosynthesis